MLSQSQRTMSPRKERHTKLFFKRPDLPTDCGLRKESLRASFGKGQVSGCRLECSKQVKRGQS